jgi:hypothetical protein
MKLQSAGLLLAIILLSSIFSGCQSSGLTMPKLAFWKKDDKLDPSKLEPPSRQFTPAQTEVAEKGDEASKLDSGDGPPVRPDIASAEKGEKTMEEFEQEVNRTWAELANKTKTAEQEIVDNVAAAHNRAQTAGNSINQAVVDTANVSMPPASKSMDNNGRPLTPRYATSGMTSGNSQASLPSGSNNSSYGGFTPPSNSMASNSTPAYERLAPSTAGGFNPLMPANTSTNSTPVQTPASPTSVAGSGSGNLNPPSFGGGSFVPQNQAPSAGGLPSSLATAPNAPVQNPYAANAGPSNPAANPTASGSSSIFPPLSANPASTVSNASPARTYESTPYKAFESGRPTTSNGSISQTGQLQAPGAAGTAAQIPASLQISGQGSYAPGSIRMPQRPQATAANPPQPVTPAQPLGGGSFVR